MADPTLDDDDGRLLAALGAMAGRLDPVPAAVVDAARDSFTWRTVDAELAELAYDSLLDDDRMAGVRSAEAPRALTFEGPELCVEVEVAEAGDRRRLLGQVVPGEAGTVEVRHRGGTLAVDADEVGRFPAAEVAAGPVSLRFLPAAPGRAALETSWVLV